VGDLNLTDRKNLQTGECKQAQGSVLLLRMVTFFASRFACAAGQFQAGIGRSRARAG